jgi:hypothetical protein
MFYSLRLFNVEARLWLRRLTHHGNDEGAQSFAMRTLINPLSSSHAKKPPPKLFAAALVVEIVVMSFPAILVSADRLTMFRRVRGRVGNPRLPRAFAVRADHPLHLDNNLVLATPSER